MTLAPAMPGAAEKLMKDLLQGVGVRVGGSAPYDPQILNRRFYGRVLRDGSLGLGESYVEGWWEVQEIDGFIYRVIKGGLTRAKEESRRAAALSVVARVTNSQSPRRAARDVKGHYELGVDLFRAMLDDRMTYSCGYWKGAGSLEVAQEAKLDLVCRKLRLDGGKTLLDIGCGWGSLVGYASERYGVRATGITVSPEQAAIARRACQHLPVEIRVQDYREVEGQFDAVVSVGMFEHVGPKNYRSYMQTVDRCLAPGGISLLHTIAGERENSVGDPWISRYIFPGAVIPTLRQIARAAEGLFVIEDVHAFGPDYDRTLCAWHRRFQDAWPTLKSQYDERFRRLWSYYLLSCAGAFRARSIHVLQLLLTRPGGPRPEGADVR